MHSLFQFLLLTLLLPVSARSQFYYKDILSTGSVAEQMQRFKAAKVHKAILRSFESSGEAVPDFICIQEITPSYNAIKTKTQTIQTGQSVLVSQFNFKGQLVRSSDSSNTALNYSIYTYDAGGLLQTIETSSQAYAYQTRATEKHQWFYKEGKPVRMLNIKNNSDTTEVKFVQDEKGNIAEEEWFAKGKLQEKFYYYYNEANQLTDIVRFNEKARRLLPDFLFEYTPAGLLQQMIAVQSGSSNYLIWKYEYNEKGLKIKESCYSKQKQLLGYITYSYE